MEDSNTVLEGVWEGVGLEAEEEGVRVGVEGALSGYPSSGQIGKLDEAGVDRVAAQGVRTLQLAAKFVRAVQGYLGLPDEPVEDIIESGLDLSEDAPVHHAFVQLGLWAKTGRLSGMLVKRSKNYMYTQEGGDNKVRGGGGEDKVVDMAGNGLLLPPSAASPQEVGEWWLSTFSSMFGEELEGMREDPAFTPDAVSVLVDSIAAQMNLLS